MKILVVGDVHWSQYSSILRKRGEKYSYRLENLIKSVNWVENLSDEVNADKVVYLGDFFDRSDVNSEELTALQDIVWSKKQHYFLVGNHEAGRGNLSYNSANIFDMANFEVIPYFYMECYVIHDLDLIFLPYILENNKKGLEEYLETSFNKKRIIFSHNDIKGIQMGNFISKEGFTIEEIQQNCDLFLNGHLHNGKKVADKIINVGNLSGQNFSEDAFVYDHSVILLDTDTLQCAVYNNPYALNFYHLDFTINNDIDYINNTSLKMKNNCVCTIKCLEEDLHYLRCRFDPNYRDDLIPYNCNVIDSRFIVQSNPVKINTDEEIKVSINYLDEFYNYMINTYGNNEILVHELQEVCK